MKTIQCTHPPHHHSGYGRPVAEFAHVSVRTNRVLNKAKSINIYIYIYIYILYIYYIYIYLYIYIYIYIYTYNRIK